MTFSKTSHCLHKTNDMSVKHHTEVYIKQMFTNDI